MSINDRKALRVLIYFLELCKQGFFSGDDNIRTYVDNLVSIYKKPISEGLRKEFLDYFDKVDTRISSLGYKSNSIILYNLMVDVSEQYMNRVKGLKQLHWSKLHSYATQQLTKNHLNFPSEIDKAVNISEILLNSK